MSTRDVLMAEIRQRDAEIASLREQLAQAERERDEAVRKVHAVEEAFEPKGEWSDQMHPTVNGICPECYSLGLEAAEAQVRELVAALEAVNHLLSTQPLGKALAAVIVSRNRAALEAHKAGAAT